jgi:hypothetical protein
MLPPVRDSGLSNRYSAIASCCLRAKVPGLCFGQRHPALQAVMKGDQEPQ